MSVDDTRKIPAFIPVVAGGVSGVVTRSICQPLDVIKIRFQLQVEPISRKNHQSKYRSIPQATALIVKEEGLSALWKGHVPAQALSLTYGVVQFGVFETLMGMSPTPHKASAQFASGFVSGFLATVVSFPFDVVRTRLVVQGNEKVYRTTMEGLRLLLRFEGLRGLFKGLSPTLLQVAPLSGFQFASYHFFKRLFQHTPWLSAEGDGGKGSASPSLSVSGSMVAGSASGFVSKLATYPLDLIRKRLQFQGFQEARKGYGKNFFCSSLVDCVVVTVRDERLSGLFKGLVPSLLKSALVNALIFTVYEQTHAALCEIYVGPLP